MKKTELVYRLILEEVINKKNRVLSQAYLAKTLGISLSTVNNAISPLRRFAAVNVNKRSLEIINPKKILYYWASIRNIEKDIIYKTRVNLDVVEIEKLMPPEILFGAYSAYKFMFKEVPSDYSEVYIYTDDLKEIKKRFKENKNIPNLIVLKKQFSKMTPANIFIDLWNLKDWYAKDFLKALEEKLDGLLA